MSDSVSQSPATTPSRGLTSEEARRRLLESGLNAVIAKKSHLILALLGKFWAPVPWMLEATIVLELALASSWRASSLRYCWCPMPRWVALPATFTLATALGAVELAKRGVLVTRLSAIEEAAAMDMLCSDKTGTITQNRLSLAALHPYPPFSEQDLLRFAAFASDEAGQDPIDLAILARAKAEGALSTPAQRVKFVPFEPGTKLAEATVAGSGRELRALKGAPQAAAARVGRTADIDIDVERLAAGGYRVLAVAGGPEGAIRLIGLLALQDLPREDSKSLVTSLNKMGVRVAMVTGVGLVTARAVAAQVGIAGRACSSQDLRENINQTLDCAVFAGVFPEDKFRLVRALQQAGRVVGMTGDGVNDVKQAEVGIAVASATDVAKASASLVLTNPGLTDTLAAVETSRRIYQRMLTYTLNKIIKTVEIGLFLSIGVILTRDFIITPLLIVMLLFTNDFVTMSIATDHVSASPMPDRWHFRTLMRAGMSLGSLILLLSFGLFFYGHDFLRLPLPQLQTLVFVTLVFTGQGMVYLVRERGHFWNSAPSRWMILSSIVDVSAVCFLSTRGILMAPLPDSLIG